MMRGKFQVEQPSQVEITFTATLSAKDWLEVAEDLQRKGGATAERLGRYIEQMLARVGTDITGDCEFDGPYSGLTESKG